MTARLLILSGLPGTGKTTLARDLCRQTGATHLRIDSIEAALSRSALNISNAADAGYQVGCALASDNLRLGRSVVADSVNPVPLTRQMWSTAAAGAGAPFHNILVHCSDADEHRRRVEARQPDMPGQRVPTWSDVLNREFENWPQPQIEVDMATLDVDQAVRVILSAVGWVRAS